MGFWAQGFRPRPIGQADYTPKSCGTPICGTPNHGTPIWGWACPLAVFCASSPDLPEAPWHCVLPPSHGADHASWQCPLLIPRPRRGKPKVCPSPWGSACQTRSDCSPITLNNQLPQKLRMIDELDKKNKKTLNRRESRKKKEGSGGTPGNHSS